MDVGFDALAHTTWGAFGQYAVVCVGLVVATDLYSLGRQVASVDALLTTLYGQALMSKIGLMLAVGAFGWFNSMPLHTKVAAPLARLLRRPLGWTPLPLRLPPAAPSLRLPRQPYRAC